MWSVSTATPIAGTRLAHSGAIVDSQTTSLSLTLVFTTAGMLSFAYHVSSESSYDYLTFYVDGTGLDSWSGEASSTYLTSVTAGTHTFRWDYSKDSTVSVGSDAAWIDNVAAPTAHLP